ncbi:TolC family protein [Candidatus Neptunochlamydia vexilliferae]|uniref:TolC family protein n=1 Tax=Candidatus Neptunichlamydia vexilliferae TaxID=1651774 RepID=UPI001891690A|nr:TolC family protein [Candidatus Neptunochlamydia vexilliferae]
MLRAFCFSLVFLAVILCQGCDVKGANNPYAYAPTASSSVWHPPEKARRRLPDTGELEREEEDYELFSKEAPMTLAEIIDVALSRNPTTRQSWAAARVSAAEYGQSLQDFFVLADIDGDYARSRYSEFTGSDRNIVYETQYGVELDLTYTILDFGQTRMTSEAALQSLYNADWSHNSQIQQTIQLIMTDYYNYLYQKQLLFSNEQDVVNAKVTLDATEEKFRRGLADVSDIVQAKTNYLSQKLAVVNQKQNLHNAYTELTNDMGLPSNGAYYFQDYPEKIVPFKLETLDKLIVKANDNRPDLMAAEAEVKSSIASMKAARLQKYPVVTGDFNIGRQYYNSGISDHYDFAAQVSLTFPLFQGFFIENTVKKARATLEESRASLEQIKLDIIQEVSNYRSDVSYAKESIEYAKAYLSSAEEDFKVNLKKYRVGTGTIIDLINAQTSVADARSQLAQAQNNWYTSVANLAYATGVLFSPKEEEKTPYIELIKDEESLDEKPSF